MAETIQMNLRLSKALVYDIEYIAQQLNMNRTDWLKFKISDMIAKEKLELMQKTEKRYIDGFIGDEIFQKQMGFTPSKEIKKLRNKKLTVDVITMKKASNKYFEEMIKDIQDENKMKLNELGEKKFIEYYKKLIKDSKNIKKIKKQNGKRKKNS